MTDEHRTKRKKVVRPGCPDCGYVNAHVWSINMARRKPLASCYCSTHAPFQLYLRVAPHAHAGDRTPRRVRHASRHPRRQASLQIQQHQNAACRTHCDRCWMVVEAAATAATLAPNLAPSSPIHGSGGNEHDGCNRGNSSPARGGCVGGLGVRSQAELVLLVVGQRERIRTVATRVVEA